jgi:hypothetical protein
MACFERGDTWNGAKPNMPSRLVLILLISFLIKSVLD